MKPICLCWLLDVFFRIEDNRRNGQLRSLFKYFPGSFIDKVTVYDHGYYDEFGVPQEQLHVCEKAKLVS